MFSNYHLNLKVLLVVSFILLISTYGVRADNLDEQIFFLINHDLNSPYLDTPMLVTTYLGDGLAQGLAIGGLYLTGETDTAYLLTSALAKTWWTTALLKYVVGRPRPGATHDDVNFVGNYQIKDNRSFPSGHTTGAFAVATVLSDQYPKYTPYFYTYASLVGLSRIYTGVHYPSDVLVGAVLGYIIGQSTLNYKNLIIRGNVIEYSIRF